MYYMYYKYMFITIFLEMGALSLAKALDECMFAGMTTRKLYMH